MDAHAPDAIGRVAARLPSLTRGRVLDLGCGEGRFLPRTGVGVDLDDARLRIAWERSPRVVRANARRLPFARATFDTVYAHRMLNDTGDVDGVLAEIVRVLRGDGRLLVFTRARRGEGDRLDRANGRERLGAWFERVTVEDDPADERAALFVADRPRPPGAERRTPTGP